MNQNKNLGDHGVPSNYVSGGQMAFILGIIFSAIVGIAVVLAGILWWAEFLQDYFNAG